MPNATGRSALRLTRSVLPFKVSESSSNGVRGCAVRLHKARIGPVSYLLFALLTAGLAGNAASAASLPAVGETIENAVTLADKQVVLPGGSWIVAGSRYRSISDRSP